jgi:hypothetical protein
MHAYRGGAYHELDPSPPALKTRSMRFRLALIVASLLAFSVFTPASDAHAQGYGGPGYYQNPPPAPPRGVFRSGLIFGGAVGLGGIFPADCDDCDGLGAFGLQGHIGGMLGPQLALFFDASALYHVFGDGSLLTSATFLGVIRGWLGSNLWLQVGAGLGYLEATDQSGYWIVESRSGGAALVGAGIEVLQTPNFALDIQLRLSLARFSYGGDAFGITNAGVFVGFNWY